MGFHPGGRGRAIVETYQAAAEQYGYIVAGSNNSRNGPWAVSIAAVRAMSGDLASRFSIDAARVYLTGHSGGARVAMEVAMTSGSIAGVIASSAGFADSRPRASVPFAVFGTAGTEDFNYIEMRLLDRKLTHAASSCRVCRWPHAAADHGGVGSHRVDGIAGHEVGPALAGRCPDRDAVRETSAPDRRRCRSRRDPYTSSTPSYRTFLACATCRPRRRGEMGCPSSPRSSARSGESEPTTTKKRGCLATSSELEASLADPERAGASARPTARQPVAMGACRRSPSSPARRRARRALRTVTAGAAERIQDPEYRKLLERSRQVAVGR